MITRPVLPFVVLCTVGVPQAFGQMMPLASWFCSIAAATMRVTPTP